MSEPGGSPKAVCQASRMVRKGGFEPPRSCDRQPLKLVRLPFRHFRVARVETYPGCCGGCAGGGVVAGGVVAGGVVAAGGVLGAGVIGAVAGAGAGPRVPRSSEPGPRWPMTDSIIAPTMNSTARTAVAFDRTVAPARAPNADWLLPPPNAAAMSPFPCCSRITNRRMRQVNT